MNPKIYPVIHYLDADTALAQVEDAIDAGADGCFLISHRGNDAELLETAVTAQQKYPDFPVGINMLTIEPANAAKHAAARGLPLFWADDAGVASNGISATAREIADVSKAPTANSFDVFASVAFKYQEPEANPVLAAQKAREAGFIPTTSGNATGRPPSLEKIITMSEATNGVLAIASGMTPGNVSVYAPYLSHILVATGVAADDHRMDKAKLRELIANARC